MFGTIEKPRWALGGGLARMLGTMLACELQVGRAPQVSGADLAPAVGRRHNVWKLCGAGAPQARRAPLVGCSVAPVGCETEVRQRRPYERIVGWRVTLLPAQLGHDE